MCAKSFSIYTQIQNKYFVISVFAVYKRRPTPSPWKALPTSMYPVLSLLARHKNPPTLAKNPLAKNPLAQNTPVNLLLQVMKRQLGNQTRDWSYENYGGRGRGA